MYLAIEYLARTKLFREWFAVPCSLFVQEHGTANKIAVTINEEFKQPSSFYCVKHWHVCKCNRTQALPSFTEYRVSKSEIFTHRAVVLPGYRLLRYNVCSIPFDKNCSHHPMDDEIYKYFFDHYLDNLKQKELKLNWLWKEFLTTYLPHLSNRISYIPLLQSETEIATDQRNTVAMVHGEIWQCWIKWCKYMLYLDSFPGELIFLGEYHKEQGGLWKEKSPQASSALLLP